MRFHVSLPKRATSLALPSLLLVAALLGAAGAAPAPSSKPHPAAATHRRASTGAARAQAKSKPAADSLAAGPALTVVEADAESVLDHVGAAYRGFTSYHFEGTSHMEMSLGGQTQKLDVPFRLAAVKPAKMRTEILNPMMSVVSVSDGSQTWMYVPQAHQYTHQDAAPLAGAGGDIGSALAMGTPIQRYVAPLDGLLGARIAGHIVMTQDGAPRRCTVVIAQFAAPTDQPVRLSPNTMWVDDATHAVVRDSVVVTVPHGGPDGGAVTMSTTTTFGRVSVDQPVPDSLFAFAPPADAKLVDKIAMGGAAPPPSPLIGKPAQDFELADLAGAKHSLSGFKGKVVLVDFWATWCGPCRRELPNVVKLRKELAAKGLEVVAVDVGEAPTAVNGYLHDNQLDLPVWLDRDRKVSEAYGANAIPTLVVVGRDGVVSSLVVGLHDESDLRALLQKAGIE